MGPGPDEKDETGQDRMAEWVGGRTPDSQTEADRQRCLLSPCSDGKRWGAMVARGLSACVVFVACVWPECRQGAWHYGVIRADQT